MVKSSGMKGLGAGKCNSFSAGALNHCCRVLVPFSITTQFVCVYLNFLVGDGFLAVVDLVPSLLFVSGAFKLGGNQVNAQVLGCEVTEGLVDQFRVVVLVQMISSQDVLLGIDLHALGNSRQASEGLFFVLESEAHFRQLTDLSCG